jgi:hypothetical protein
MCFRDVSWTVATGGKLSPHEVFSTAFTLLLRFCRFDRLAIEQVRANAATPPLGSLFSPKNLLLVQNCTLAKYVQIITVKAFGSKQTQSLTKIHVKQTLVWFGLLTKSPCFGAGDNDSRCQ